MHYVVLLRRKYGNTAHLMVLSLFPLTLLILGWKSWLYKITGKGNSPFCPRCPLFKHILLQRRHFEETPLWVGPCVRHKSCNILDRKVRHTVCSTSFTWCVLQENYRMGGKFEWPAVQEAVEYRRQVRQLILRKIEVTPFKLPITRDSPWVGKTHIHAHRHTHIHTHTRADTAHTGSDGSRGKETRTPTRMVLLDGQGRNSGIRAKFPLLCSCAGFSGCAQHESFRVRTKRNARVKWTKNRHFYGLTFTVTR